MIDVAPNLPAVRTRPLRSTAKGWAHVLLAVTVVVWGTGVLVGFIPALAALTVAGLAAVILGLHYPTLGLLGAGMMCTLDAPARVFLLTGGIWRWNTFNYWLLLVMLLSLPVLLRLRDTQTRILQMLILLLGLQLAISSNRLFGVQHLLGIIVLFGLLVYFRRAGGDERVWYWSAVLNGTLAALGGLVFYLQLDELPYINPNVWAYLPVTGLFAVVLGLFGGARGHREQFTLMLLAIVNAVWVFLSGSRGTVLVAFFTLIFIGMGIRPRLRGLSYLALGLLVGVAISLQFPDQQSEVLGRLGTLVETDRPLVSRTSGRSDLAMAGWHIFLANPMGVGTGGFADAWARLGDLGGRLAFHRTGLETQAHSAWTKTLAENGLHGVILLATFVASFALVGMRRSRRDPRLRTLGWMVTAVLAVAFVSTEFQGKGLWFLAAGAMTLFHRPLRRPRA